MPNLSVSHPVQGRATPLLDYSHGQKSLPRAYKVKARIYPLMTARELTALIEMHQHFAHYLHMAKLAQRLA